MNDLAALVPGICYVIFPTGGDGTGPATDFYFVPVTLASLGLSQYAGITGAPWTKTLHRYEQAIYASGTLTNSAALAALADQVATDWYLWQLARLDQQYVGFQDWEPEGLHDIEWRQADDTITTRIMRGVFDPQEDLLYQPVVEPWSLIDGSSDYGPFAFPPNTLLQFGSDYSTYELTLVHNGFYTGLPTVVIPDASPITGGLITGNQAANVRPGKEPGGGAAQLISGDKATTCLGDSESDYWGFGQGGWWVFVDGFQPGQQNWEDSSNWGEPNVDNQDSVGTVGLVLNTFINSGAFANPDTVSFYGASLTWFNSGIGELYSGYSYILTEFIADAQQLNLTGSSALSTCYAALAAGIGGLHGIVALETPPGSPGLMSYAIGAQYRNTSTSLYVGDWGYLLDSTGAHCQVQGLDGVKRNAFVAGGIVVTISAGGSGSGSDSPPSIYRVSLGTASASGTAVTSVTATIPSVTVPAGTLLVVQVGVVESGTDGGIVPSAATFAGHALNEAISIAIESSGILFFTTLLYSLHVTSTTTGDLVVTVDGGDFAETWLVLVSAEYVSGLVSNISDKTANNTGLASTPNSGTTATTTTANEYAESAFMLLASSAGTWGGGFTSGGQDVSGTISGVTFVLSEGYQILSKLQTVTATMTGTTTAWSGCVVTFD